MSNLELLNSSEEAKTLFFAAVNRHITDDGSKEEFLQLFDICTIDSDVFVHTMADLQRKKRIVPGLYRELASICSAYGYSKANSSGIRFRNVLKDEERKAKKALPSLDPYNEILSRYLSDQEDRDKLRAYLDKETVDPDDLLVVCSALQERGRAIPGLYASLEAVLTKQKRFSHASTIPRPTSIAELTAMDRMQLKRLGEELGLTFGAKSRIETLRALVADELGLEGST